MARSLTPEREAELEALHGRCVVMLDAFGRAEPNASFAGVRAVVEDVAARRSLSQMRAILRELRGMQAGLTFADQRELNRELADRFGPDPVAQRDAVVVERVRKRGHIRTEREYWIVCAYADAIAIDLDGEAEYLALGGLLDRYMPGGS